MTDAFQLAEHFNVFTDTLFPGEPCIFLEPRNHESLFFVTDGALSYTCGGVRAVVPNGAVGYIARGSADRAEPLGETPVSYIAMNFNFEFDVPKEQFRPLGFPVCCRVNAAGELALQFQSCLAAFQSGVPGGEVVSRGILLQIIGSLLGYGGGVSSGKLQPGMAYLNRQYASAEVSVERAARLCSLSEVHFRRLFTGETGVTPSKYIQQLRLRRAKALLEGTAKSVGQIALECGYSDVYSFSHAFYRLTGEYPAHWQAGRK